MSLIKSVLSFSSFVWGWMFGSVVSLLVYMTNGGLLGIALGFGAVVGTFSFGYYMGKGDAPIGEMEEKI